MAEEKEEVQEETAEEIKKKGGGSSKLLVIIIAAAVVLGAVGFVGFKLLAGGGGEEEAEKQEVVEASASSMVELDPFVLNLSDHGRYLKVTLQFEISDPSQQDLITNKTPQLRDTIITLVSSKSLNSISSAEGKFQLKDELLFRANQIIGMEKDVLKNLYFTEFVMQ
jgi:flagellar FliL protein